MGPNVLQSCYPSKITTIRKTMVSSPTVLAAATSYWIRCKEKKTMLEVDEVLLRGIGLGRRNFKRVYNHFERE